MNRLLIPNTCQVPNVIFDKVMPGLGGAALKVLLAIIRQTYGFNVPSRQIGLDRICKLSGLSRQGVVNGIKELGHLIVVKRGPINSRVTNEYALNVDISTGELVNKLDQSINLTSQQNTVGLVNKVDSLKPNLKPNIRPGAKAPEFFAIAKQRKLTRPDAAALAAFDAFYQAYPRHVDRPAALKAWLRLNPDTDLTAKIYQAVESQKSDGCLSSDPKFIPHPATWLNGRRWEDEPVHGPAITNNTPPAFTELPDGFLELTGSGTRISRRDYQRRWGNIDLGGVNARSEAMA